MIVLLVSATVGDAWASSCVATTVATSLAAASDVFVGTVLSVRTGERSVWLSSIKEHIRISSIEGRIRIERSWKGAPAGSVVTVLTNSEESACGVSLAVDHEVILFAYHMTEGPWKGRLTAGLCSHSYSEPSEISAMSDSLGAPLTVRKVGGL